MLDILVSVLTSPEIIAVMAFGLLMFVITAVADHRKYKRLYGHLPPFMRPSKLWWWANK